MTLISIVGVALGVMVLIVVLSVMGGFEESLQKKMLRGEPHLEIFAKNVSAGFSLLEFSEEKAKQLVPEATGAEAFTKADVVIKHRRHLQSAELIGVDVARKKHLWLFADKMTEGSLKALHGKHSAIISEDGEDHMWPGIILGEHLAGGLGVDIGDELIIVNPRAATDSSSVLSGATTTRHFVLVGTFNTRDVKFDNKLAVVSIAEGRKFMADYDSSLDDEKYVTGIAMNLADPYDVENIEERFAKFKDIQPLSWQKTNKSLLFALKLEKFAMGSILMLIVVVAAFSISGTMMMTVYHRRMQVSLLRALGMTRKDITRLYMFHGFSIGVVGITVGLLVGLLICWGISSTDILSLPSGIYYQTKLPVKFIPNTYIVICFFAWIFSLVASTYPALTAASESPSLGLRYD